MRGPLSLLFITIFAAVSFLSVSCEKLEMQDELLPAPSHSANDRDGMHVSAEARRTLIYYCLGYNSLSNNLRDDLSDLVSSEDLPSKADAENALVVFEDLIGRDDVETPVVYRLYKGYDDMPVRDTLFKFEAGTPGASSETLRKTLEVVVEKLPSRSYGMLFSSHATGWVPPGVFNNDSGVIAKSVGQCEQNGDGGHRSYEIDLKDFAKAFPCKFDYILFDACLMGGVEVAYELKDVCNYIGFSQAEVAAAGFNYHTLLNSLISGKYADPVAVCRDYYEQYVGDAKYGATISLVDCSQLDRLAVECERLFRDYAYGLSVLSAYDVQGFFLMNKRYYFDLEDMLVKAGVPSWEMAGFRDVMEDLIVYKAATPSFMGFRIYSFCGLSSYMPSVGNAKLNEYYKTLAWNKATSLVK